MAEVAIPSEDVTKTGLPSDSAELKQLNQREQIMEQLDQQVLEERNRFATEQGAQPVYTAENQDATPKKEPEKPAEQTPETPERKVRVKVDGVEKDISESELIATYQKNTTADARLELAAGERKKLKAWEDDLKARESALQTPAPASAETADPDIAENVRQALTVLAEGDMDEASRLLVDILKPVATQPVPTVAAVDPRAIANQVKDELATTSAWDTFIGENPEFVEEGSPSRILGDHLFKTKYNDLMAEGMSYQQALNDVADEVRKMIPTPSTKTTGDPEPTVVTVDEGKSPDSREARKEKLDTLTTAASRAVVTPQQDEDDSPAAVIAQMRKARRLPD